MAEQPSTQYSESPKPVSRSAWSRFLKRALFSLFLLLAIPAGLNLILSTRSFLKPITRPDPDLLYALKENSRMEMSLKSESPFQWRDHGLKFHISINAAGWRGPMVPADPSPGEFRILCLGDSITMGLGVDDEFTWPVTLNRLLSQARPDRRITVINGGVYGYSSQQGLYLLRQRFLNLRPQLVIWGYGWNDSSKDFLITQRDLKLVPSAPGEPNSATWNDRVKYRIESLPLFLAVIKYTFMYKASVGIGHLMELAYQAQQEKRMVAPPGFTAANFKTARVPPVGYEQNLDTLYRLSRQYNFGLVFISFYPTPKPYRNILNNFARVHQIPDLDFSDKFERLANEHFVENDPAYRKILEEYQSHLKAGALASDHMLSLTVNGMHPNRIGTAIVAADLSKLLLPMIP